MKRQVVEKNWLGFVLAVCLFLSCGIVALQYAKYQRGYQQHINELRQVGELKLRYAQLEFLSFERQVISTVHLLAQGQPLHSFLLNNNEIDRRALQQSWSRVLGYQPTFSQLRFIEPNGMEQIKVVRESDGVTINSQPSLQSVAGSHYFRYAQTLPFREAGAGIALVEQAGSQKLIQHVTLPLAPQGERLGYLVVDLDFWLSPALTNIADALDMQTSVLTLDGHYLVHTDEAKLFGFHLPERQEFALGNRYPELWAHMQSNDAGDYLLNGQLFVFHKVSLAKGGEFWLLLQVAERDIKQHIQGQFEVIVQQSLLLVVLLFAVALPCGYLVMNLRRQTLDSKLALAALNGMSAVLICDRKYLMLKVNREFENITGYSERQIRYGNARKLLFDRRDSTGWFSIWDTVAHEEFWEGELKVRGRAGIELTTITRIQAVKNRDGQIENYIISIVDISERKELEEQLRYQSERDGLTQLWNRRKFEQELRNQTSLRERYPNNHSGCLALVDIDHFKRINDEMGHDEGDRVIKQVANILTECTRRTDYVSRIGGEEFAILMPHTELTEAEIVLERIRSQVADNPVAVTISIGFTDLSADSTHSYKCADIALYESKSMGRNKTSICHSTNDFA